MQFLHIFTFPVYIAVLTALYLELSKAFKTYKYYIIVHVLINVIFEVYTCYFMLPITHLPHPLMRTTGWLAHWGFSGLIQFYFLAQCVIFTGSSVLEMFYFRFKVCIFQYQTHKISKVLKFQVFFYRLTMLFHPIAIAFTFQNSLVDTEIGRNNLFLSDPTAEPEITCYSVMLAVSGTYTLKLFYTYYAIQTINCFAGSLATLLYITNFVKKSVVISKATERMQLMLIFSLFIQSAIHLFMIITPIMFMVFVHIYKFTYDQFARFFLFVLAYHGFMSTCGMILFTKPLRDKILPFLKNVKRGRTEQVSSIVQSTAVEPNRL